MVDFSNGINAIIGDNGSGKSTILESIGSVLFQSLDYNQKQFIRDGCKTGAIELELRLGKGIYSIVKTFGSNPEYYIEKGNERIVEKESEIVPWLKQKMGIEQSTDLTRLFQDVIGVPQGLHTSHFLLPPASRKKIFDPILNIESYEECWNRLRKVINIAKEKIQHKEYNISELNGKVSGYDDLQKEKVELQEQIVDLEIELNTEKKKLAKLELEKQSLENKKVQYDRIPRIQDQIEINRDKIKEFNIKLGAISDSHDGLSVLTNKVKRYESIQETLQGFMETLSKWKIRKVRKDELELAILYHEKENKLITRDLEQYDELSNFISDFDLIKNDFNVCLSSSQSLAGRIRQLEEYEEYVNESKCPILKEKCNKANLKETFKKKLDKLKTELNNVDSKMVKLSEELDNRIEARDELRNLNDKKNKLRDNIQTIEEVKGELYRLNQEYIKVTDIEEKKKPLEKELEELKDCKIELEIVNREIAQEDEIKDQLNKAKQKLKEYEDELSKIEDSIKSFDIDTLDYITEQFNKQVVSYTRIEETLSNRKETLNMIQSKIKDRLDIKEQIKELSNDLERYIKVLELIEKVRDIIKKIPEHLTEQYLYHINYDANVIYTDITNESQELEWSSNYEVRLGNKTFQQLSGGEQMVVALSIRLALLKNLTNIDISFFDEPTVNLDEPHRSALADMISRIQGFNQLFVISHDNTFDSIIENIVHIKKENDISVIN